jgi:hypothetical protein
MFTYSKIQVKSRNPWLGDRLGGLARFLLVLLLIFLLGSVGAAIYETLEMPGPTMLALLSAGMRYYLLVAMAFFAIFVIGGFYIQAVYTLDQFRLGLRYTIALVFGFFYPSLQIEEGQMKISDGKTNLLEKIGGPGFLVIQPGSLVLLEGVDGEPRVCAEGLNFVTRFEKIREVINLDDQKDFIESLNATTKDGIRIQIRDVSYGYRLRTGRTHSEKARQDPKAPHPFSYQAVLKMVYGRSVGKPGLTPWERMVRNAIESAIANYIRENRFDEFASPRFGQPETRVVIAQNLDSESTRARLKGIGAELLWADIGHFEVVDERVDIQRAETWGAKHLGIAEVKRAFGDAKHLSFIEIGRAEAEAEILMSILSVFDDIEDIQDVDDSVRSIILTRTAQILEGMSKQGLLPGGQSDELPPPSPPNRG